MGHVCLMGPCAAGHLTPLAALGQELQRRGHTVSVVAPRDAGPLVTAAGLGFHPIAEDELPPGASQRHLDELGSMSGIAAARLTFRLIARASALLLRDAPGIVRRLGADLIIGDQVERAAGTVAEHLGLPFVTLCSILPSDPEPAVPPFGTPWPYSRAPLARVRNQAIYHLLSQAMSRNLRQINAQRASWGLPRLPDIWHTGSRLAVICQVPAAFDFPRTALPPWFHYVGPLGGQREPVPFPFEDLTGAPLVYASLGTVLGRATKVVRTIAEACQGLEAQLVVTLGRQGETLSLPGSPVVVGYAPQLELLRRAALTVTHAGLNTTIESLSQGVPLVAIPICNDQPGVAARIVWTGTGEMIPLQRLTARRLREAVRRVLGTESYRRQARRLQAAIAGSGGAGRAAAIIETVLATGTPVVRDEGQARL